MPSTSIFHPLVNNWQVGFHQQLHSLHLNHPIYLHNCPIRVQKIGLYRDLTAQCYKSMVNNIDKGLVTGVVFIDLRKAFDTLDTDILLAKLKGCGVTDIEHQWFWSYLTGRSQTVSVDGHLSDHLPVNIGVLQGSILGPLLFMLFLNDLPTVIESCDMNMFADDTEIDFAAKPECSAELEFNVNSDLCRVK